MNLAAQYRMKGNDSCFYYSDRAIEVADNDNDATLAKIFRGAHYIRFTKYEEGINYLSGILAQDSTLMSDALKSRCYNALGILYEANEVFDQVIKNGQLAVVFGLKAKDSTQLIDGFVNLSRGYKRLGRDSLSILSCIQAMDIALAYQDKIKLYKAAHNLFSRDKSIITQPPVSDYLTRFLKVIQPSELPKDGYHTGFQFLNQYDLTIDDWKKMYEEQVRNKDFYRHSLGFRYSYVMFENNQFRDVLELNQFLYEDAITDNDLLSAKLASQLSYEAAKKLNDFELANEHLETFHYLNDRIQSTEVQKNVDELNVKYETAQKEQIIAQQELKLLRSQRDRNLLISSLLGILVIGGMFFYIFRKRQRYHQEINQKERQLQAQKIEQLKQEQKIIAMDYMLEGEERERKRIAKDLHDSLGALLTSAKVQLNNTVEQVKGLQENIALIKAQEVVSEAAAEVRRISHDMMPDALINLGLISAIEDLAKQYNRDHSLQVNVHCFDMDETKWSDQQRLGTYRIIQELCQNVLKHAQADNLIIQLSQDSNQINLIVEDDGIGFDPSNLEVFSGIGLKNIKSRVQYLNGSFDIDSVPGGPTIFEINFSLT